MTQQLLTLDEYNNLAARMLHKRLGRIYVTYDNIGLVTHYLIRADMAYVPNTIGHNGMCATLKTFRWSWFLKLEKRIRFGKRKSKAVKEIQLLDDMYESDYFKTKSNFCVQNYISEQEYKDKFNDLKKLIDDYFDKSVGPPIPSITQVISTGRIIHGPTKRRRHKNESAYKYMIHFYIDGLTYKEIAAKYGISPGAVQTRIRVYSKKIDWSSLL